MRSQGKKKKKKRAGVPSLCENDKKKFCSEVVPGKGRTHSCLRENYSRLNDMCRLHLLPSSWKERESDEKGTESEGSFKIF